MPDHHEDSRRALDGGDHRKPDIHRDVLLGADLDGADDLMGHVVACDQRRIHAGGDGRENNHIATSVAPADQGTVFRIGQDVSDAAGERRVFLPDRIGVSESLSTYEGVLPCALRFAEYFTVWAQVVAGCCSDAGVAECSTDHRHIYASA